MIMLSCVLPAVDAVVVCVLLPACVVASCFRYVLQPLVDTVVVCVCVLLSMADVVAVVVCVSSQPVVDAAPCVY